MILKSNFRVGDRYSSSIGNAGVTVLSITLKKANTQRFLDGGVFHYSVYLLGLSDGTSVSDHVELKVPGV